MKLYLLRHGDAVYSHINRDRPLSELGKQQITLLANFLKPYKLEVDYIYHSGILRAQQTAEMIANSVQIKNSIEKKPGLEPNDPVSPIAFEMDAVWQPIMLVAHLPFLSQLISKLILGNENYNLVDFAVGNLVCLEKMAGHWSINWMLKPELLR